MSKLSSIAYALNMIIHTIENNNEMKNPKEEEEQKRKYNTNIL